MNKETTYGLRPEQLARLLGLAAESEEAPKRAGTSRTPAKLLRELLASERLLDPQTPDSLPAVLNRPCNEVLAARGRTMNDLLLDSETDLTVVQTLKDYGKEFARRRGSKAKQAAATVIYYGAIASALVFHGKKISQHSHQKLHDAYTQLEQKPWIPSELKDLFRRAMDFSRPSRQEPE